MIVPLKEISVDIKIIGFVAEVTSSLLYINNEESPVEAEFTFPIDDGSAVFSFEADIQGRHIVAEIQEKEQAKQTYQDAIEKGSTALLLKEDDTAGDIFQCAVGNLPPNTDAKISFSYVKELPQEPDGKIRFTLPTVLNPRYSPDTDGTVAATGATYSSPEKIPYNFNMVASIKGYHKVKSVTSEQDKLKVEILDDTSLCVSLAEKFQFNHDLSFLVEYENCYKPQVILETGNDEAVGMMKEDLLMVNFYPEIKESATSKGEYIFVIDRSGSMSGRRMKNAKEALFLFLKSLPVDCYFNVIGFGSDYSSLFELCSAKYTENHLKDALSLLEKMGADMGGTEIYKPLQYILAKRIIEGYPRQIFLLTDGEVSNTQQVIGLVKSYEHSTRVFTIGIGSGASSSLIKGVARAGNGKAELIADKDRIQPKVVALLKSATQPLVSNIKLKWLLPKHMIACTIPKQPPTYLGAGERLCLYVLLAGGKMQSSAGLCGVTLTGDCRGKEIKFETSFSVGTSSALNETAPLHRLAAKAQIKELEINEAEAVCKGYFGSSYWRDGSDESDESSVTDIRQNMILVSTSSNIVSKMTAFVAVDKEAQKPVLGKMVKRPCPAPVAMVAMDDVTMDTYCNMDCDMNMVSDKLDLQGSRGKKSSSKSCKSSKSEKIVSRNREEKGNKMLEMLRLQHIDGHWPLTKDVTALLGVKDDVIKSFKTEKDADVKTTLAVVVWLRSKFSDKHDEWEMIERKALAWLCSKTDQEKSLEDILEQIKGHLWPRGL